MADQVSTTPEIILERIVARLTSQLSLDAEQIFLASNPDLVDTPSAYNNWYVVTGANGQFKRGHQIGGGTTQLTGTMVVVVTVFSAQSLDQQGREDAFYTNDTTGIYRRATEVMAALAEYELQNASNERLVSFPIKLNDWSAEKGHREFGSVQIGCELQYIWNLS